MSKETIDNQENGGCEAPRVEATEAGDKRHQSLPRRQGDHVFIRCPICRSDSPESQERLRWIARMGLARFLTIARTHGVVFAREQKRDICNDLLTWDTCGVPGEVDWLIHEHAIRAALCAQCSFDADSALLEVMTSGPDWNANYYKEGAWDIEAENLQAKQLKLIFGESSEED